MADIRSTCSFWRKDQDANHFKVARYIRAVYQSHRWMRPACLWHVSARISSTVTSKCGCEYKFSDWNSRISMMSRRFEKPVELVINLFIIFAQDWQTQKCFNFLLLEDFSSRKLFRFLHILKTYELHIYEVRFDKRHLRDNNSFSWETVIFDRIGLNFKI